MIQKRKKTRSFCQQCKIAFSHRADHPNKYCSRQCAGEVRKHQVKCKLCQQPVKQSRNIFCSIKCANIDKAARTIKTLLCDECGVVFSRHQCHITNNNNFCSRECFGIWGSKYRSGENHPRCEEIGAEKIRKDSNGRERMWVKIAQPNIWRQRARREYELRCESIPDRKIVHHRDKDTLNDDIYNLVCVTKKWHINFHRKELTVKVKARMERAGQ